MSVNIKYDLNPNSDVNILINNTSLSLNFSNNTTGTCVSQNITGPAGLNGTNGLNGLDGATGPAGTNGTNGTNGLNGTNGVTGPTGPSGPSGSSGNGSTTINPLVGPGLNFPAGWGSFYRNKLNNASNSLVRIMLLGDSISSGSFASNQIPNSSGKSWANILMKELQAVYGVGGSGFVSMSSNINFASNNNYTNSQLPVSLQGSWIQQTYGAACAAALYYQSNGNCSATFYTRGISIEIYYFCGPNQGSLVYTIDGSSPISFNTYNVNTFQTKLTINNLSSGEHSITISNSGALNLIGVGGYNATGVVIDNCSFPGLSLNSLSNVSSLYGNVYDNAGGKQMKADLIIISLGLNDNIDATTFQAKYIKMLTTYKQGSDYTNLGDNDILSVIQAPGLYGNSGTFDTYRTVINNLSKVYNMGVIDLNTILLNNSYNKGIQMGFWATGVSGSATCTTVGNSGTNFANSNSVHESDIGHLAIANVVKSCLL